MFKKSYILHNPFFFLLQMDDEDSILPHKLQTALEYVLEKRKELASDRGELPTGT